MVSTRVGSVGETVLDGKTGYLVTPGARRNSPRAWSNCCEDPQQAAAMGRAGREHVIAHWSVDRMVEGYQDLLSDIYTTKSAGGIQKRVVPTVTGSHGRPAESRD